MPDEFESLLRDTLQERSADAPPAGPVAQRILAAARATSIDSRRARRPGWLLPVIAACAVVLVVGAALAAVAIVRHVSSPTPPAAPTHGTTAPAPSPSPSASLSPSPSPSQGSATPTAPTVGAVGGPVPSGLKISDLTFVSADEGWGLGTAPCAHAPCTSLVRTTDGGRSWVGIRPPAVGLTGVDDCLTGCISHVRFATPLVGYLFGPTLLYLTTDGGATWQRQTGGAVSLEIGNGTVLRVDDQGCLPGCGFRVQRAPVGSSAWRTVLTIPPAMDTGAEVARTGHQAFVLVYGHVAGGASSAHSTLFASTDDGATWTNRGEPCPQTGSGEIDASALTTAPDGAVAVLCTRRVSFTSFIAVSSDGGASFRAGKTLTDVQGPIGASSAAVVFVQGAPGGTANGELVRSADGGGTWQVVAGHPAKSETSGPGFLGFETPTTGRWVSRADPATVWTTTDAGAHWTAHTFG